MTDFQSLGYTPVIHIENYWKIKEEITEKFIEYEKTDYVSPQELNETLPAVKSQLESLFLSGEELNVKYITDKGGERKITLTSKDDKVLGIITSVNEKKVKIQTMSDNYTKDIEAVTKVIDNLDYIISYDNSGDRRLTIASLIAYCEVLLNTKDYTTANQVFILDKLISRTLIENKLNVPFLTEILIQVLRNVDETKREQIIAKYYSDVTMIKLNYNSESITSLSDVYKLYQVINNESRDRTVVKLVKIYEKYHIHPETVYDSIIESGDTSHDISVYIREANEQIENIIKRELRIKEENKHLKKSALNTISILLRVAVYVAVKKYIWVEVEDNNTLKIKSETELNKALMDTATGVINMWSNSSNKITTSKINIKQALLGGYETDELKLIPGIINSNNSGLARVYIGNTIEDIDTIGKDYCRNSSELPKIKLNNLRKDTTKPDKHIITYRLEVEAMK